MPTWSDKQPMTGGCQCGAIRYAIDGDPLDVYVCHCAECRRQSSSAFGISVIVDSADLTIISGTPKVWTRKATVGGTLDCAFCPTCGSRLYHGDPERDSIVSVKGGSLDTPPDLARVKHIWVTRKLDGVLLPEGVETFDEEPPT